MKKFAVPIFTEEYRVNLCIGKKKEILKEAARFMGKDLESVEEDFKNARAMCWNLIPERCPLIIIDTQFPLHIMIASVAHEASHAVEAISDYIYLKDRSGEFHAHGIAAIMRAYGRAVLKKRK